MGGGGVGGVWVFLRQLILNEKGDLLITLTSGPNKHTVTFLVDTGAQISVIKQEDAAQCGIKVPHK